MAKKRTRRSWGAVRKLPSGRHQASYVGPDGIRYLGPRTFASKDDAVAWLAAERRRLDLDAWIPPTDARAAAAAPVLTFADYALQWLDVRPIKDTTRDLYTFYLETRILPYFGDLPLDKITSAAVRSWWAGLDQSTPTGNRHAYSILRAIFSTAVEDELVNANPARIKGAGSAKRVRPIVLLSPSELADLAAAMPARLSFSIVLAAWCALRFGETSELRRFDISPDRRILHVRRGVVYRAGAFHVTSTKSDAGHRDVSIPPHIVPALEAHLAKHVDDAPGALLFPGPRGGHLHANTYRRSLNRAAEAIGRPGLRPHDLRHYGAIRAAQAGATVAELMARLGHTTPQTAMIYQSAATGRDAEIAARLSELALE